MQRLILFLAIILFLPALSSKPFYTRGEAREALVALNMYLTSDFILPEGYAGDVPSKPPLLHWAANLVAFFSGEINEFSLRLPSVIAATLIALYLGRFFAIFTDRRRAFLSVLILLTSLEWIRSATAARVDMLLAAAMTLALTQLFYWSEKPNLKSYILIVLALSVAFLSKGPVALVLPAAIHISWRLINRVSLTRIIYELIIVFPAALILPLSWYVAAYLSRPTEFLAKIYYENVARFTSSMDDEPHKHNLLYLYGTLILGLLPWSVGLLAACYHRITLVNKKKTFHQIINTTKDYFQILLKAHRFESYALLSVLCIVGFFSIPSSKRSVYLLPAYPFIAFLLSYLIQADCFLNYRLVERSLNLSARFVSSIVITIALLILTFYFWQDITLPIFVEKIGQFKEVVKCLQFTDLTYLWLALALSCSVIITSRPAPNQVVVSIIAVSLIFNATILRATSELLSAKQYIFELLPNFTGRSVYSFSNEFYSISFYSKKKILRLNDVAKKGDLILLFNHQLSKLQTHYPNLLIKELSRSEQDFMKFSQKLLVLEVMADWHPKLELPTNN